MSEFISLRILAMLAQSHATTRAHPAGPASPPAPEDGGSSPAPRDEPSSLSRIVADRVIVEGG